MAPSRRDLGSCWSTGLLDRSHAVLAEPLQPLETRRRVGVLTAIFGGLHNPGRCPKNRDFCMTLATPAHSPPHYWSTQFASLSLRRQRSLRRHAICVAQFASTNPRRPFSAHVIGRRPFRHAFSVGVAQLRRLLALACLLAEAQPRTGRQDVRPSHVLGWQKMRANYDTGRVGAMY